MNTKHLKARILDLALQGKLVENSRIPNDVKSRIPTDFNPPFEIPNSWAWVKLGDLGEYKKGPFGSSLTKSIFVPKSANSIKVYEQKNAIQKNFELGDYFITKEYFLEKMQGFIVKPNDIIISCAGTIGEVYRIPKEAPQGIINQALMRVRLNDLTIFEWFIVAFNFVITANSHQAKGTAIKNIPPFYILKSLYIPLPPKDEQERIVKKIDELFSQIDILDKHKESLLKNIKHTKTRILYLALQGKLVENSKIPNDVKSRIPSDFNPHFEIPNSWAWVKLGDICEISSGGTPSRNEAEFWENGTIPWLKIADIKDDYVNSSSEFITQKGLENSSAKIFKKGTLLFTIFATLGEVAILNIDASTNQAIVGLTPKKDNYITKFIFFALKNIKNSVNLIGRGATQKNINQTILKNLYIPLPPLDEQERIVKKIDELFEILEVIENSL
ncbi:MAG: restriction endonuclease subunit S [Campylobacter sp.]|uniref:restriction endonuclease subunit S n=1 Tax=Campylobacter sp. TaxID=205 RepID=UPI002AA95363|nr:restriction endonuclease subunit S [Campylobacter sp.]MCI6343305.1 restriction endonuclease subunit S [Campylobacter sp.]